MIGYIYRTTNLINNKIYIGQHKYDKQEIDKSYLGSGKLLLEAIKKYGRNNFDCEILDWCETQQDLNDKEIYYIKLFQSKAIFGNYNLSDGGFVPRLSGELNGNYGHHRPHTEAEKIHLSNILKGHKPTFTRKHTLEERLKMSAEGKQKLHNIYFKDYKQLSQHHTGARMMTNGLEQHWVYKDDIDTMLSKGWWIGSCCKRKQKCVSEKVISANKRLGDNLRNTVWVHRGCEKHQVKLDELEFYYSKGFTDGMKDK